jgi:Zn finger protein HypA/HybF involved in hydrogenase expression
MDLVVAMKYLVECNKCKTRFNANGEEDWQSVGDGGPAECTGVELVDASCPKCGNDDVDIVEDLGLED